MSTKLIKSYVTSYNGENIPYAYELETQKGTFTVDSLGVLSYIEGLGAILCQYTSTSVPMITTVVNGQLVPLYVTADIVDIDYTQEVADIISATILNPNFQGIQTVYPYYSVKPMEESRRIEMLTEKKQKELALVKEQKEAEERLEQIKQQRIKEEQEQKERLEREQKEREEKLAKEKEEQEKLAKEKETVVVDQAVESQTTSNLNLPTGVTQPATNSNFRMLTAAMPGGDTINKGTVNEEFIPRVAYYEDFSNLNYSPTVLSKMTMIERLVELYAYSSSGDMDIYPDKDLYEAVCKHFAKYTEVDIKVIVDTVSSELFCMLCRLEVLDMNSVTGLYEGMYPMLYLIYMGMKAQRQFNGVSYTEDKLAMASLINLVKLALHTEQLIAYDDVEDDATEPSDSVIIVENEVSRTSLAATNFLVDILSGITIDEQYLGNNGTRLGIQMVKDICNHGRLGTPQIVRHNIIKSFGTDTDELGIIVTDKGVVATIDKGFQLSPHVLGEMYEMYQNNIDMALSKKGLPKSEISKVSMEVRLEDVDYNTIKQRLFETDDFKNKAFLLNNFKEYHEDNPMRLIPKKLLLPRYATNLSAKKPIGLLCEDTHSISKSKLVFLPLIATYLDNLDKYKIKFAGGKLATKKAVRNVDLNGTGEVKDISIIDVSKYRTSVDLVQAENTLVINDYDDFESQAFSKKIKHCLSGYDIVLPSVTLVTDEMKEVYKKAKFIPTK